MEKCAEGKVRLDLAQSLRVNLVANSTQTEKMLNTLFVGSCKQTRISWQTSVCSRQDCTGIGSMWGLFWQRLNNAQVQLVIPKRHVINDVVMVGYLFNTCSPWSRLQGAIRQSWKWSEPLKPFPRLRCRSYNDEFTIRRISEWGVNRHPLAVRDTSSLQILLLVSCLVTSNCVRQRQPRAEVSSCHSEILKSPLS